MRTILSANGLKCAQLAGFYFDFELLTNAIQEARVDGNLSCEKAWEIARRFDVSKMKVSSVCEQLKIKIKPCQLGAF